MKKLLISGLILMCLVLIGGDTIKAGDLELWRLREMFKAKLNPDPNYFPDEIIDQINMKSAQIASIHGFCCPRIDTIVLQSGQIDYLIPQHSLWNYAMKPLVSSGSDERAWQSINIQDVGKKWTGDVSNPNFFYNWTDQVIHVDPAPTATASVLLYYFAYLPTSSSICDTVVSTIINCAAVDVDTNGNIYAGYFLDGMHRCVLYKSIDSAATWDTVWDGIGYYLNSIFVTSNNYVYAGQYKGAGVMRSTDVGATWDTCLSFKDDSSYFWQMAEDTLGNLFIGEYCQTVSGLHRATVWKSADSGATWDTVWYGADLLHIHTVAVDPYTNYLYVTTDVATIPERDNCFFLRSDDAGATWDTIATGNKARYTGIEFSSNYRILADDYADGYNSDIFITDDDDSANFVSTYTYFRAWLKDIVRIGDNYYVGAVLTDVAMAKLHLMVSYDEGQHWSIAKNYNNRYGGGGATPGIQAFANRSVDGWTFYSYRDSLQWQGQLRKFKETVRPADLDNKCRDAILTLSTMQYWIRNGRTDLAVNYWNLASQQTQVLRQGFLQKAYDIIITPQMKGR